MYYSPGEHLATEIFTLTILAVADTTPPAITITSPTTSDTLTIASSVLSLSGTASDNIGVSKIELIKIFGTARDSGTIAVDSITAATKTSFWHKDSVSLVEGATTLIVRAYDAANLSKEDTLKVTYTKPALIIATVSFDASSIAKSVGEADGVCSLKVILDKPVATAVVVKFTAIPKTAIKDTNFSLQSDSVTFASNNQVAYLPIKIIDNSVVNANKSFSVSIVSVSPLASTRIDTTQKTSSITINDNETLTAFFKDNATSVNEAAGICTLTVKLTIASINTINVLYALGPGSTATPDSDFTCRADSVKFNPGETSKTILIPIINDKIRENTEHFKVILTAVHGGAVIEKASDSVTILDDERVYARFANKADSIVEPLSGTATLNLPVRLSCPVAYPVTVSGDNIKQNKEYFVLGLTTIVPGDSLGINDLDSISILDTSALTVSCASAAQSGAENKATGKDTLTVVLSKAAAYLVTVNYTFTNGTAFNNTHFTATNGTLTFVAGTTSMLVPFAIANNTIKDGNRTFTFTFALTTPNGATLGSASSSSYTITNDEQLSYAFALASSSGSEAKSPCSLTVNFSTTSSMDVTIPFTVIAGATASGSGVDSDYVSITTSPLTINAGSTTGYIIFRVPNDTVNEDNESFTVELQPPTSGNATVGTNKQHADTITDNDPLTVAFKNTAVTAEEGGTAVVRIISNRPSEKSFSIEYIRRSGSATAGRDFTPSSSLVNITFFPNETEKIISIPILSNHLNTDTTSIVLQLQNPTRATLGALSQSTIKIHDLDALPTITFSSSNASLVTEGTNALFTLSINDSTGRNIEICYSTETIVNSALAGQNFSFTQGSKLLTAGFAGTKSQSFSVATINDQYQMEDLIFKVRIDSIIRILASERKKDPTAILPPALQVTIGDNDPLPSNVIAVNSAATNGLKNGLSWKNAYTDLQEAVNASTNGYQKAIWVASGTYYPTKTSTIDVAVLLAANVELYGGFKGKENAFSQRPLFDSLWRQSPSILDGTIPGGTNSKHLIIGASGSLIDGFTLQKSSRGSAVLTSESMTIRNCIIQDCYADSGAGMKSSVRSTLENVVFLNNDNRSTPLGYGGAFWGKGTFRNCIFFGNGSAALKNSMGGAINSWGSVYINCTFAKNQGAGGGAILTNSDMSDSIINCIIFDNVANMGSSIKFTGFQPTIYIWHSVIESANQAILAVSPITGGPIPALNPNSSYISNVFGGGFFKNSSDLFGADGKLGGSDDGLLLAEYSPGLNYGSVTFAPAYDITGLVPRTGAGIDAGAYEQ